MRFVALAAVSLTVFASSAGAPTPTFTAGAPTPTYTKDVAPILYRKCVECHRETGMAPMSLMTFDDARPWARAVKQKVVAREMPPWGADPAVGRFANDPSLKQSEIDAIVAWADGGAPKGNPADLPAAPKFADGWTIGQPDYIFTMLEPFTVPADGTMPYLLRTPPSRRTTCPIGPRSRVAADTFSRRPTQAASETRSRADSASCQG